MGCWNVQNLIVSDNTPYVHLPTYLMCILGRYNENITYLRRWWTPNLGLVFSKVEVKAISVLLKYAAHNWRLMGLILRGAPSRISSSTSPFRAKLRISHELTYDDAEIKYKGNSQQNFRSWNTMYLIHGNSAKALNAILNGNSTS